MRLTAFTLALLILVLSCLPCVDTAAMSKSDIKASIEKTTHDHSDHSENDMCSPFCHCACCSTVSIVNPLFAFSIKLILPESNRYVSALSADIIEISLPVWQPPQLA